MNPPGRRFYVDFSATSQNEPHLVYNLHYVLALQKARHLAEKLGEKKDAQEWYQRTRELQTAIRESFYQDDRWYDDLQGTTCSQLGMALAVLTDAAESDEIETLLDAIAARSLDPSDEYVPDSVVLASPFMHHYIFEALRKGERFKQVVDVIRLRWGRWVKAGYPTTWENWNVDFPDGSQCHSFSAHPRYHLAKIAESLGKLP
jgi:hypothetical protein